MIGDHGGNMHSYTATEFVAFASRSSDQAFLLVSIDPALLAEDPEEGADAVAEALEGILPEGAVEQIATCCGTTIVTDSLEQAYALIRALEDSFGTMPDLGLISMIYARGHAILGARQDGLADPELPLALSQNLM